jgi:hypothetical protein
MMNVYNGNVMLDGNGEAWAQLPEWFQVLNIVNRYQLIPDWHAGSQPGYCSENSK